MVTIRLARRGAKKNPFYHVTVAEKSAKRDGRFIERIGFYNPIARGGEVPLRIDLARLDHWLAHGAQPTERVRQLAARARRTPVTAARPAPGAANADADATADAASMAEDHVPPGTAEGIAQAEAAPAAEDSVDAAGEPTPAKADAADAEGDAPAEEAPTAESR